jgi:leucyl aminopeptidase
MGNNKTIRKNQNMITVKLSDKPLYTQQAEGYAYFCEENFAFNEKLKELAQRFYKPLPEIIKQRKFTGGAGSTLVVAGTHEDKPVYIILVGVGSQKRKPADLIEQARRAAGSIIRLAEQVKIATIAVEFPDEHWFGVDGYRLAKEIVTTMEMATYHFDQYITDESRKHNSDYTVIFCAPAIIHDKINVGVEHGERIGHAVNQARLWCDLPACVMTPTKLADQVARIGKVHNFKVTIFDEKTIIEMGMGGLASVSRGSAEECRFIVMEYKTEHKDAPTLALVGKGVTFDSGGLSIKPAARMDEMKDDMAGAAAVISSMEMIAHLKPRINIVALAAITENLPSGTATKPGDIVQFYNGKTAEIKNTDAEGRLILADALSYAVKHYKPDAMINLATLTGSCAYALGPFFCGLMSQHDELAETVLAASNTSGDRAWPLPFHDDYKVAIRSTVSDMCNIGNESYRAGSITAGFFLQNFVGNTPWVHLDIAGTSFNVPDRSYYRPGATGFGVRMIADLVTNWKV